MAYGKRFSRHSAHDGAYSSRPPSVKRERRALASRYGLNAKTARKRRKRTTADEPMGPKTPKSTLLTPAEKAIVVAFRHKTLLPLHDVLVCLKDAIPISNAAPCTAACSAVGGQPPPNCDRGKNPTQPCV
jgi:hypothetical protein